MTTTLTLKERRNQTLWDLCLTSLARFYLADSGMLAGKISWDGRQWIRDAPNVGNTADAAIALYRLRALGRPVPLDPDVLLRTIVDRISSTTAFEHRALMLWAAAIGNTTLVPGLCSDLVNAFASGHHGTLVLARTLSALSECLQAGHRDRNTIQLAQRIYAVIIGRQSSRTGLVHASGRGAVWWTRRQPIASLSAQTYSIHALAMFSAALGDHQALDHARRCADAICRLQGPTGQWWWQYDVARASVQQMYPVFSVNQDTAIPMSLGLLQRALGEERYRDHIERGLDWLFGDNELQRSLVDEQLGVIWRAVEPDDEGFRIVPEMRSYHPGRCLYALSLADMPFMIPQRAPYATH